jgi:hypothetical protein
MKTNLSSRSLDDCTFNEDESVADEKHCVNKDPFKAAHDCYENEILNPKLYGETSSILRYKRGVVLVLCAIGISILVGFLIAVVNRPKTVAMLDRSTVVFLIPPPDNIQQICNKDAIAVNLYQSRLKCLEAWYVVWLFMCDRYLICIVFVVNGARVDNRATTYNEANRFFWFLVESQQRTK